MMNKKHDLLGIFLAATTGIAMLAVILVRTFLPTVILPKLDAGLLIAISLVALLLDHYLVKGSRRCFLLLPLYAALIFGLFPYAASLVSPMEALKLALLGAAVFTAVTYLFDTMIDRLSTGPVARLAPIVSAFCLYLAAQCLMGII